VQLKLDIQPFPEAVEIELLQAATVEKDILSVLAKDKPETAIANQLLDRPFH